MVSFGHQRCALRECQGRLTRAIRRGGWCEPAGRRTEANPARKSSKTCGRRRNRGQPSGVGIFELTSGGEVAPSMMWKAVAPLAPHG